MDKSLEGNGKPGPTRIGHQFLSLHNGNPTVVDENFVSENFQTLISIFSGCNKINSPSTPLKQVASLTTSMILFARRVKRQGKAFFIIWQWHCII